MKGGHPHLECALVPYLAPRLLRRDERGTARRLLRYLGAIAPAKASSLIQGTLDEITERRRGGKISFGLLAAVWATTAGMKAGIAPPFPHAVVLFQDATGTRSGDIERADHLAQPGGGGQ